MNHQQCISTAPEHKIKLGSWPPVQGYTGAVEYKIDFQNLQTRSSDVNFSSVDGSCNVVVFFSYGNNTLKTLNYKFLIYGW